jgi:hypothetical protein
VARGGQFQRLALQRDGAPDHVQLDIQLAQVEVVAGQFGREQQAGVFQVRRRLLGRGVAASTERRTRPKKSSS